MRPQSFRLALIPFEQMWDDTHYWLPHILAGECINAIFYFNEDNEAVKNCTLQII